MTSAVELRRAALRFGPVAALDDVSLSIPEGITFGIVGESGSGKTTLMRAALGLRGLDRGEVRLFGSPLRSGRGGFVERARLVQPIFQDPAASLSPRVRIGALLAEVGSVLREPGGEARRRVAGILGRLGLPEAVLGRFPHEISGGRARRVAIARALLMRPRLIIADEPTAGLDVSVQGDLLNLLQDLRSSEGITLVVVSHNLAVVRLIADQVAVMRTGRVVEQGAAADVFERPADPCTRALLSSWPGSDGRRAAPVARASPPGTATGSE